MSEGRRTVIYFTSEVSERLSENFVESELVGTRDTYGANHPLGEYIRQSLGDSPEVDVSDYEQSTPSVRYTDTVTVEFPPEQYESLYEQFRSTPIAEDPNCQFALAGNTPFAEYLRLCISHFLDQDEESMPHPPT
ncbi:hypothetical protein [Halomicrococcus gelatinilyticus]|uniref:hypothetical protein n=1 Tax=Halomicrococcus gelatinilyticus TaxID=1702103 RepID=UPI002E0FA252